MASADLSKLCICIVTLLSLAMHATSSQTQSQPTITNDAMPTDEQLISLAASSPFPSPYPENPAPESGGYMLLSSDYSPSPAPSLQEYLGYYETYSPVQSPAPAQSSKPGSNVLPFNYKAEDESEFDAQDFDDSDESKNRGTVVCFVLGAVCLVGLAERMLELLASLVSYALGYMQLP
ncbi:leucine-rich repeat extensin-like protein 2 [Prunus yedoensis var. nudiflora]|uniref:Leucine-rich repeat extensin-like protein 2 n=1 Tax=Prunus yedoensis var. nudiflora TaxID=2094558 RepID=A0A314ZSB4_PRUYE|nr:leucine-rich repeat extensin-like protein 2 [Prunus yedoensis var. nudiflora]